MIRVQTFHEKQDAICTVFRKGVLITWEIVKKGYWHLLLVLLC